MSGSSLQLCDIERGSSECLAIEPLSWFWIGTTIWQYNDIISGAGMSRKFSFSSVPPSVLKLSRGWQDVMTLWTPHKKCPVDDRSTYNGATRTMHVVDRLLPWCIGRHKGNCTKTPGVYKVAVTQTKESYWWRYVVGLWNLIIETCRYNNIHANTRLCKQCHMNTMEAASQF